MSQPSAPVLEGLEPRQLLSGDVFASIAAGSLILRGDRLDNQIVIDQDGLAENQIRITAAGDTTVNGAAGEVILEGFTGNIRAKMGDGDDVVTLSTATVTGAVSINGGRGNNAVTVDAVTIASNLMVNNAMGDQTVVVQNDSDIGGWLKVLNGKGDNSTTVAASSVTGKLSVRNGNGNQTFALSDSDIGGMVHVGNKKGTTTTSVSATDVAGNLHVANKTGDDTFSLVDSTVGGNLKINNQKGNSDTTLGNSSIAGNLRFNSIKGQDAFAATDVSVGARAQLKTGSQGATIDLVRLSAVQLALHTGKAADVVNLTDAAGSEKTMIKTTFGDDAITVDSDFTAIVNINGGRGEDTLDWLAASTFVVDPVVNAVESIV